MEKKSQKSDFGDYNLLNLQDLWQPNYQILLITLLKIFIKLNVSIGTKIKNVKVVELNPKFANLILKAQTLKMP